ncbi:hypothetical protein ACTSKR_11240 [Chitinibacteraceae bacterium HSL-7]
MSAHEGNDMAEVLRIIKAGQQGDRNTISRYELGPAVMQLTVTGVGAVSATVAFRISADGQGWEDGGTLTASGTDVATISEPFTGPYPYIEATLTSVSAGAQANVTLAGGR